MRRGRPSHWRPFLPPSAPLNGHSCHRPGVGPNLLLSCFPYIYAFMQWQPEQDHVGALMVYPETMIDLAII